MIQNRKCQLFKNQEYQYPLLFFVISCIVTGIRDIHDVGQCLSIRRQRALSCRPQNIRSQGALEKIGGERTKWLRPYPGRPVRGLFPGFQRRSLR